MTVTFRAAQAKTLARDLELGGCRSWRCFCRLTIVTLSEAIMFAQMESLGWTTTAAIFNEICLIHLHGHATMTASVKSWLNSRYSRQLCTSANKR